MLKNAKLAASVGLLGLATLMPAAAPVSAADIYDQYAPRTSSPYDDPRYGDIYQHPAPPQPRYVEPRLAEPRYVEPRVAEPLYVEPPRYAEPRYDAPRRYYDEAPAVPQNRYGYLEPMNPRSDYRGGPTCIPRGEIRRALINEGWRDFRDLELRGEVAKIQARRPNGQLYALKVDRCSGEIVHSRPLHDGGVPYAYRDRYSGNSY